MAKPAHTDTTSEIKAAVDSIAASFSHHTASADNMGNQAGHTRGRAGADEPPHPLHRHLSFDAGGKHQGALTAGLLLFAVLIVGTWLFLLGFSLQSITFDGTREAALFQQSEKELSTLLEEFNTTVTAKEQLREETALKADLSTAVQKKELRAVLGAALTATNTASTNQSE